MQDIHKEAIRRYLENALRCLEEDSPAGVYGAIEAAKALLDYEVYYG